jgi:hypothetical protein
MSRKMKLLLLALLVYAFSGAGTQAQTINAASCSSTDVQAALNSVAADGTVVNIPAGTCTWTTAVSYNQVYSTTIQGQTVVTGTCAPGGSCTATDNTTISDGLTRPSGGSSCGTGDGPMWQFSTAPGKSLRLTGVSFTYSSSGSTCVGTIRVSGTGKSTRIDHSHFTNNSYVGIGWTSWTYGVVDHNLFSISGGAWNAIKFEENNWIDPTSGLADTLGVGDGSWGDTTTFGSNRAVYVENNTFTWGGTGNNGNGYADDCTSGGRFVWRFNQLNSAMLQTHPTGGGQRHRGCRVEEVYMNTFTGIHGQGNDYNAFWLSSGSALVWGNTTNNGYSEFVTLHSMRRNNNTYTQNTTPGGWGYCGTSFSGTGSNWDLNSNSSSGRRCIDRPGAGIGDRLVNDFPNVTNHATGCTTSSSCAWIHQQLEPVYEWLNTAPVTFFWNAVDGELLANEDYYNYTASFNGTSGVGSGTLASRPSSCTPNPDSGGIGGVSYWATDQGNWNQSGSGGQGQLYTCTATNTWTPYYTPYAYPHPLVAGSSVGTITPPTNLNAIVN